MKLNKLWAALLATSFAIGATMSPSIAEAQKGKKPGVSAPAGPATATKPIAITPADLKWGMSIKQVAEVMDKQIDAEYKPLYQKTTSSVRLKELDAAVAEAKSQFRRSRIDFGKLPVATDSSPLKGEYTYLNKESLLSLSTKEQTRHFFFIQDRLWKIIDEVKFSEKGPVGKTFMDAAVKLSTTYGVPGRVIPPDENKGIFITQVDWKDSTTHVRLIERSDFACAIAYEDQATLGNPDSLRSNKPKQEEAIDPAVAAAIRGEEPPPGPPAKADPKKK